MPAVKKGESERHYVDRAIPIVKQEHPEKPMTAILGQVYGMYKNKWGLKKSKRKSGG